MEDLRVIDNLEEDILWEEDVAKEKKRRQREAARAARGGRRGAGLAVGWAGGVVRRLVARRPLRRQVNEAGASCNITRL